MFLVNWIHVLVTKVAIDTVLLLKVNKHCVKLVLGHLVGKGHLVLSKIHTRLIIDVLRHSALVLFFFLLRSHVLLESKNNDGI